MSLRSIRDTYQRQKEEAEKKGQGLTVSDRQLFIDRCYSEGGKPFVEALLKHGCNEQGEDLRITDWLLEYAEAIGDFRLPDTYTSGCSQLAKTLLHTSLLAYCITEGRLNTLWSYDQQASARIQVKSNFRPFITHWLKRQGVELGRGDSTELFLFQFRGADAQFTYVSTSEMKTDKGTAAAGGIAVGVSRDILFNEEASQYKPGSADPLRRRLDAGRLPSRPVRELGTPGAGLGIEAKIEKAQHNFYPHYHCPECHINAPLHPKGCLLKPIAKQINGITKQTYISESGRPIARTLPDGSMEAQWWYRDGKRAIASAYFGCVNCGSELSNEVRSAAWFQCLNTGIKLRALLDSLPQGVPVDRVTVGITISPLLRTQKTNRAAEIIEEGLNTGNTADWQQQVLGCKSESSITAITMDMLKAAMAAPRPLAKPEITLAGIDQGRGQFWLWIADIYLPLGYELMSVEQVFDSTVQVVRFASDVMSTSIVERLKEFNVGYGLIDNEPERKDAAEMCRMSCLEMADQKPGQMSDFREIEVESGGSKYPCWGIANEKFLKRTLDSFALTDIMGYPLQRLPPEWERWISVNSEMSPLRHLQAPSYDPNSGKWNRGAGHIDDLYYACMFQQAAFYLWFVEKRQKVKRNQLSSGSLGMTKKR